MDEYVTSWSWGSDLKTLIRRFPDINDYFKWAFDQVEKRKLREIEANRSRTKKANSDYFETK